jgi:hypothetical protein
VLAVLVFALFSVFKTVLVRLIAKKSDFYLPFQWNLAHGKTLARKGTHDQYS